MTIRTERLILEPWKASDWEAFRPIATDPEVMRYITGGIPWTDEQVQNFVGRQVNLYAERGFCRWKLMEASTAKLIGFCGPGIWRDAPDPEIGWWLARSHWGRGLATEAARAALLDAFDRVGLKRIISIARPENLASISVMKKIGLEFAEAFESEGIGLVRYEGKERRSVLTKESEVKDNLKNSYRTFLREKEPSKKEEGGRELIRAIFGADAIAKDSIL